MKVETTVVLGFEEHKKLAKESGCKNHEEYKDWLKERCGITTDDFKVVLRDEKVEIPICS